MADRYFVTSLGVLQATNASIIDTMRHALFDEQPDAAVLAALVQAGVLAPDRRAPVGVLGVGALSEPTSASPQPTPIRTRESVRTAYVIANGKTPKEVPQSVMNVFNLFKGVDGALTVPDVVSRASIDKNTARWAIQVLRKQHIVKSVPAHVVPA